MDDPEDEQDSIRIEHVVDDAVIADPQPVEGVACAVHRVIFNASAPWPARSGPDFGGEMRLTTPLAGPHLDGDR